MTKEEMLTDDHLDEVAGGADAEPQDALMFFMGPDPVVTAETLDTTKIRMPGMAKYGHVTLKRG